MTTTILKGDCRDILKTLPDQSVHCCVTSPPYFGLRDYGTAKWEGGDFNCDHKHGRATRGGLSEKQASSAGSFGDEAIRNGQSCHCGATRIDSQIGLEATPDAFVAEMVAVFREVKRVLRDDGTLWLNLGDSYAGGGGFSPNSPSNLLGSKQTTHKGSIKGAIKVLDGIKPKDLIGIPWRVAFALQADGWYLRQDIIWSKSNPMPESVTDRCTKAHEYIFLMSKKAKYFYDADSIKEPLAAPDNLIRTSENGAGNGQLGKGARFGSPDIDGRNKRSVWIIATQPFSEAHFATFPPDLIEPCIKAGCPPGGTVLDPFGGAGTTGLVADRLQRHATLIELNPEYADMARRRIIGDAPLFADAAE